jgi:hypothetical protein
MRRGSHAQRPGAALLGVLRSAVFGLNSLLGGCSLLIQVDPNQCEQDSDCTKLGLWSPCVQGVCSLGPATEPCDGGTACDSAALKPNASTACDATHLCPKPDQVCFKEQCAAAAVAGPYVCGPMPMGDPNGPIALTTHVQEFISGLPPKGLIVSACRASDVNCAAPITGWTDDRASGDVVLQLPYGFDGYLRVQSDDALSGLYFVTHPLTATTHLKAFEVVAPTTLATLAAVTGFTADTQKGLVILEAFDCTGKAVGGVHFEESKSDAVPFFIVDNLPNTDSRITVRDEAQDTAIGGFLNASPGFTIFSARIGANGPLLGRFNANVRANTVTYLDFHP